MKHSKKKTSNLLLVNLAVLLSLVLLPAFLFDIYKRIKLSAMPVQVADNLNINPAYPTQEDKKLAEELAADNSSSTVYKSFIGWRRLPFKGKHRNVLEPYGTRLSSNGAVDKSVWFFGGSTMWGTGAIDSETIPSWYAKKTGKTVLNLGETAWVSRQSLNQLINLLGDGFKPTNVVFYDGVNDVLHGCRSELSDVPAHVQEQQIALKINQNLSDHILVTLMPLGNFLIAPYKAIGGKLGFEIQKPMNYGSMNCSINQPKALSVAKHLLNNWYSAYLVSKGNDITFNAVLQPQAFGSKIKKDYLHSSEDYLEAEYLAVYPLIKEEINQYCLLDPSFCLTIIDGTKWLDGVEPVYIDFCHLTGKGNEIISTNIVNRLN